MTGYSLTGDTSEHALFFACGIGANGKSTFLNAVSGMLGEYHRTAPIETFVATQTDRHPTDLAGLRGARMVSAVETEEGRRWAESKIKSLTGGDKVSARFMRQDFFEYVPQFKLLIAGNHKPSLRTVDDAIRRRFHMIPFAVTIPPEQRDTTLGDRLKEEWPGILTWAIEGCIEWQEKGLAAPTAVLDATKKYLEAEDAINSWIDECCERDHRAWTNSTELFASWKAWADRSGEEAGSQKSFVQKLDSYPGIEYESEDAAGKAEVLLAYVWSEKMFNKINAVTHVTHSLIIDGTRACTLDIGRMCHMCHTR
jgi:putative DNA primase/helicase